MSDPQKVFQTGWHPCPPGTGREGETLLICRPGGEVLLPDNAPQFPENLGFPGQGPDEWPKVDIGTLNGQAVALAVAPLSATPPPGFDWRSPRTLFAGLDPPMVEALSRASMLATWDWDHRFCGRCGSSTGHDPVEAARVCPSCAHRSYPRVSPAMIVLIEAAPEAGFREPRVLLGHNRRFPDGVFSCIAGYVDAGETLEATVLREIREEVGLQAAPPTYVRSQAWPLPHSLMLGFNTTASGDPIPDGVEIEDARWFTADNLPHIPRKGTIARTLIDDWLVRIGAPPYQDV